METKRGFIYLWALSFVVKKIEYYSIHVSTIELYYLRSNYNSLVSTVFLYLAKMMTSLYLVRQFYTYDTLNQTTRMSHRKSKIRICKYTKIATLETLRCHGQNTARLFQRITLFIQCISYFGFRYNQSSIFFNDFYKKTKNYLLFYLLSRRGGNN